MVHYIMENHFFYFTQKQTDVTLDDVKDLSLGSLTEQYGTPGLYLRTLDTLGRVGLGGSELVQNSLHLGMALHADDRRTNGHYVDHLMRVTLRIVEDFGIRDENVIAAAPLHDSLEDHPRDLILALTGENVQDCSEARRIGRSVLAAFTNEEVADIVEKVTNPEVPAGQNKLDVYTEHTRNLIFNYPKPRVLKLSDFIDNAGGNHATIGTKQRKLDEKYIHQYRLHKMGLFLPDGMITGGNRLIALKSLELGHVRAIGRLAASVPQDIQN